MRAAMAGTSADLARDIARIGEIFAEGLNRFGEPWLAGAAFRTGQVARALSVWFESVPGAFQIRPYGASFKYCDATSQPLNGRSDPRQPIARIGTDTSA